jgi:hypothetical protein
MSGEARKDLVPILFPGDEGFEEARKKGTTSFENAVWWWHDLYEANMERLHTSWSAAQENPPIDTGWTEADSKALFPMMDEAIEALKAQDPARYEAERKRWRNHHDEHWHDFQSRFTG